MVMSEDAAPTLAEELKSIVEAGERPPFSVPAYELLRAKIAEYISDLVTESVRIARRSGADDVSATHVQHAAEHLTTARRSRLYRHIATVGGIMFGGALSNILSMTLENRYSAEAILITTGIAVVGAALVAFHISND
jgi:hypothetical protein